MKLILAFLVLVPILAFADCITKLTELQPWAVARLQQNSSIGNPQWVGQFQEDLNRVFRLGNMLSLLKQGQTQSGPLFQEFAKIFDSPAHAAAFLKEANEDGFYCEEKGYTNGIYLVPEVLQCLKDIKDGKTDCAFGHPRSEFYPRICTPATCAGYSLI